MIKIRTLVKRSTLRVEDLDSSSLVMRRSELESLEENTGEQLIKMDRETNRTKTATGILA